LFSTASSVSVGSVNDPGRVRAYRELCALNRDGETSISVDRCYSAVKYGQLTGMTGTRYNTCVQKVARWNPRKHTNNKHQRHFNQ